MILNFFAGLFVSVLSIFIFLKFHFITSVNKWILETSQFVYYSGHPLMNDDEIYNQITKRFKGVFTTLMTVIFKTILFLLIIFILIAFSSVILDVFKGNGLPSINNKNIWSKLFPVYLLEWPFILGSIVPLFIVPYFLSKKDKERETYSPIDKLLHYIFLGNKNVAKFLFNRELGFNKKQLKLNVTTKNIYVSGLARAGTTVLMQYLGQLEDLKSISYKNLPFLFLPKTALKLQGKKHVQVKERFHQDGITHSINSYEALEEPFWRNYLGNEFIKENTIEKHNIDKNTFKKYNAFRKLIADDKIYLAKNNNHLLRAESLYQFDKEKGNKTITIIPFREPYEQATSLLKQHKLLSGLQKNDSFTLDYMDFLVHHEFGLHTKLPLLEKEDTTRILKMNKDSLDFWLEVWFLFYSKAYLMFKNKEDFFFICYESFIENPDKSLKEILNIIEIPEERINKIRVKDFKPVLKTKQIKKDYKYLDLYQNLNELAINNYG